MAAVVLRFLTSSRSRLGKKAPADTDHPVFKNFFTEAGASGMVRPDFLRKAIPHKPFSLITKTLD